MTEKSKKRSPAFIWANLLHLSYNMWYDREVPGLPADRRDYIYRPHLRLDKKLWDDIIEKMAGIGMNMAVIDLGDGVRYDSHPEIAVRGAWSPARLKKELAAIRAAGIEPVPKLNFSACHDIWLGPYSRKVSTKEYYRVCSALISEAADIFGKPGFFHIGMDEETIEHQRNLLYAVIRQHDLWWDDLYFFTEEVEKHGCRAWVWSDYLWRHGELFRKKMPRSVLQSNWYYGGSFSKKIDYVRAYSTLEELGYDQVPAGSNWVLADNFRKTVSFCRRNISSGRLKGFMQTSWKPVIEKWRKRHFEALDCAARGMEIV